MLLNFFFKASGTVLDHKLVVPSNKYVPTDDELIPTGKFLFLLSN